MAHQEEDLVEDLQVVDCQQQREPSKLAAWSSWWGKLALELFIVFIGVSGAFALDQYRTDRDQDELRQAMYRALDNELNQHAFTTGPKFNQEASRQLVLWDQAIARGEHPIPPTFRVPVYRAPTGVWKAAVQSQAIDLIDPQLFFDMARYYNRVDAVSELFQRYSTAAEETIWPNVGKGPEAFWLPDGRIRPEVATHVLRLRYWRDQQLLNMREARLLKQRLSAAAQ